MAVFGIHDVDSIKELDQALTTLLEEPEEEPDQDINVQGLENDPELSVYWGKQQDDEPGAHIHLDKDFEKVYLGKQVSDDNQDTVLRFYQGSVKTVVIKRDTDVLTKEEETKHWKELQAAMLEELRIWVKYKCFHMRPKLGARNIMDSRNVLKWKWVKDETGKSNRIIRCRLALRGFKDQDADWLETYAGAAGRTSQRILTSEAANHPHWDFLTVDVNKAFLQGATYKELEMLTGEAPREVCFTLPRGMAQMLKLIPGFETFDERIHCLECDKPGTGSKDAPRAFSIKLSAVTRSAKLGLKPTTFDPELEVKHKDGKLVLMIAKHVDDIKVTGEVQEVKTLMTELENVFGKLTVNRNEFTNCGIRHRKHKDGTITLDQDEYIRALIPITHPELRSGVHSAHTTPGSLLCGSLTEAS